MIIVFDGLGVFSLPEELQRMVGGGDIWISTYGATSDPFHVPAPVNVRVNHACSARTGGQPIGGTEIVVGSVRTNAGCNGTQPGTNLICPMNSVC